MQTEKQLLYFGSGFNEIYPKKNLKLFYEIIEKGGVIITEYDLASPPLPYHFAERNRIVAALSSGVVLIEAKENSGSLITADYAIKLKRNLFVLPGSATSFNYKGSNKLLVNGAKCFLEVEDILKQYKEYVNNKEQIILEEIIEEKVDVPEEYKAIYEAIFDEPKTINQISIELNIHISELSSKLTLMEMEGLIESMPGKMFRKKM